MATIQQLKTQIENANALGRTNLSEKGVKLPETATTYNIMTAIAEIVSGGGSGTEYTSIVYNTDNTVTLTDKDGIIHTMSCTYADGKLIGVTYDGKAVDLTYNGDVLVKVGNTTVDMGNVPATSGATFNIAYGETAPDDTSKLWVKANEPEKVEFITSGDVNPIVEYALTTPISCKMGVGNLNTIYLFSGEAGVYKIDLLNKKSTKISNKNIDGGNNNCGRCYCNGKIYIFGGTKSYSSSSSSKNIRCYDLATDELTTKEAVLPVAMWGVACCTVGDYIYTFGGNDVNFQNYICKYDTINDTLEIVGYLDSNRAEIATCLIGNKIYLFGGFPNIDIIQCFETTDNTLSTMNATLTNGGCYIGVANIGTDVYLVGGEQYTSSAGVIMKREYIEKYDTLTDTISIVLNTSEVGGQVYTTVTYDNQIYFHIGDNIKCFTPEALTLNHGNIAIKQNQELYFDIYNGIKIGVENVFIGNENNESELCEAYLHNGTEWVVI